MDNQKLNKFLMRPSKECAYIAVFVSLLIGVQLAFSFVPGVEFVTLLLVCYAFCFGAMRGVISAICFSLLRCIIFGFFPDVVVLYLIYGIVRLGFFFQRTSRLLLFIVLCFPILLP